MLRTNIQSSEQTKPINLIFVWLPKQNPSVNPSNPNFNIDFELINAQNVEVVLINLLGQKVKEMNRGTRSSGFNTTAINTDGISRGHYLMDLTIGGSQTTTKVQVVR